MSKKPFIIAEAAQGYAPINDSKPSLDIAILLVRAAASAGADAVKFQIIFVDELAEPGYEHYELFKNLKMTLKEWRVVRDEAKKLSLKFYADIFGEKSLDIAKQINVDGIKIHSTSFFDEKLFRKTLNLGKPIYVSLGGIKPKEISKFIDNHNLRKHTSKIILMHGFQSEPTPINYNNIARIPELAELTGLEIGFMDHSDGGKDDFINISIMALANGVRYFEKHITLDRAVKIEDYISAIPPNQFSNYVKTIKRLYPAIGKASLSLTDQEEKYRDGAIKKIIALKNIKKGAVIKNSDLTSIRRPNKKGFYSVSDVVGKQASKDIRKGSIINPTAIK
tara:strand:+ start:6867 stop:7874 length:1008 start_codon:yes stop_codon:yes gene_type:complete